MKRIFLVAAVVLAACSDSTVGPELAPQYSPGPPQGFAKVRVTAHAPANPNAQAPLVGNFEDAIARVRPGGTIEVDDGDWSVADVVVDKAVTIRPHRTGGTVVLHSPASELGFDVDATPDGPVTFENLTFEAGPGGISVLTEEGANVIVRNSTLNGGQNAVYADGGTATLSNNTFTEQTGSTVFLRNAAGTISNNSFSRCGFNGCVRASNSTIEVSANTLSSEADRHVAFAVLAFGGGSASVHDNRIVGNGVADDGIAPQFPDSRNPQSSAWTEGIAINSGTIATVGNNFVSGAWVGIDFFHRTGGSIADNTVENCGWLCVAVAQPSQPVTVTGNVLRARVAVRRSGVGIYAESQDGAADIQLSGNTVDGDVAGDPNDQRSYAFSVSAIAVASWDRRDPFMPRIAGLPIDVADNVLSGSMWALSAAAGGILDAHNNTASDSHTALQAFDELAAVSAHHNDFLAIVTGAGITGTATMDATCNYWGSIDGPLNPGVPASVYTPFATQPIATEEGTGC